MVECRLRGVDGLFLVIGPWRLGSAMPFILIQGTFHLVGQTQAGNPTGFEPDGDSIQFKPANPQLLDRLDSARPARPAHLDRVNPAAL